MEISARPWRLQLLRNRVLLQPGVEVHRGLAIVAVLILVVAAVGIIRLTGGSPNALIHLGYAPILLAAYLFGWRAGLLTAIAVGVLIGPLPAALGQPNVEGPLQWAVRGTFFVTVGMVVGELFDRSRRAIRQVVEREKDGMVALAKGAEAKDTDTGEHVLRVQLTSRELALLAGLGRDASEDVAWAAMLHDVGKLHVPDRILLKPGPLDAEEWAIMRQHPIWGERILGRGDGFDLARRIARSHHENFDGSGYPDGLAQDEIPLAARIVRVTDAFDAMTNRRPYRDPRTFEEGLEELARYAGSQFDPELVELMIRLVRSDTSLRRRLEALRVR
ncbi:MAG: HD domain-containing protein [Chloroflexi bacterium]|nr:HD domain-containing protein [Chloroflexota bacterium]